MSMRVAAGSFGRPGIVMMSPQIITTNSAPAASRISRMLTTWFSGAPRNYGSVENDIWVLATHTGSRPWPSSSSLRIWARTLESAVMSEAP